MEPCSSAEERPKIKNNVVRIYDIRSSFLHHGEPVGIDKLEDIREFMVTAWRCLQGLVQLAANDSAIREQVFKILEARKWA